MATKAKVKVKKTPVDISKVEQTHGAFVRMRTVNEILGRTDTRSPEAYQAELDAMIDAKLHEHCLSRAYKLAVMTLSKGKL